MSKTDLAYIGGIIDGEGSIRTLPAISKVEHLRRYNISVSVEITDRAPLELIQSIFGGNIYNRPPRRRKNKESWEWKVSGEKAEMTIRAIKPYLLIKRARAEIALRLLKAHPRWTRYTPMERFLQEIDAKAIKELNK